jgi:hypothetical protein
VIGVAVVVLFTISIVRAQTEYRITVYNNMHHTDSVSFIFVPRHSDNGTEMFKIEKLSKGRLRKHCVIEPKKHLYPKKVDRKLLQDYLSIMEDVRDTTVSLDHAYNEVYEQAWLNRDTSNIYIDINGHYPPYYLIKKVVNGKEIWNYSFWTFNLSDLPSRDRFIKWYELVMAGIGTETKDYYLKREFGKFAFERVVLQYLKKHE